MPESRAADQRSADLQTRTGYYCLARALSRKAQQGLAFPPTDVGSVLCGGLKDGNLWLPLTCLLVYASRGADVPINRRQGVSPEPMLMILAGGKSSGLSTWRENL